MKIYTVIPFHVYNKCLDYIDNLVSNPIFVFDGEKSEFSPQRGILLIAGKVSNSYKARNIGIKYALDNGADYILFTDSDCLPDNNWEYEMVRTNGDILVGNTEEITKVERLNIYAKQDPFGLGTNGIKFYNLGENRFPTCNVGYSRKVFEKIGLFKTHSPTGMDYLFSTEASKYFKVEIKNNAHLTHYICNELKDILPKRIRCGREVVNNLAILAFFGLFLEQIGTFMRQIAYINSNNYKQIAYNCYVNFIIHLGFIYGKIKHQLGLNTNDG